MKGYISRRRNYLGRYVWHWTLRCNDGWIESGNAATWEQACSALQARMSTEADGLLSRYPSPLPRFPVWRSGQVQP